jgi:hypothetical protein
VGQRTNHSSPELVVVPFVGVVVVVVCVVVVCVVAVCGRSEVCECCCYGLMLVGSGVGVVFVASPLGCCR